MFKQYAVKHPEGGLYPSTVSNTREDAIIQFDSYRGAKWPEYEAEGYTVVPVRLLEITADFEESIDSYITQTEQMGNIE